MYTGKLAEAMVGEPALVVSIKRNAECTMLDGSKPKGTKVGILVRSDGCKTANIVILRDVAEVDPVTLSERNQSMDFLKARFKDLTLIASGGDYHNVTYRGFASDVEFLNLNTPTKEAGRQQ